MPHRACLPAIVLFAFCAPAAAGPAVDAATRAEALIVEGKPLEALAALEEAEAALWNWAPLSFRKALFVSSSNGFGDYEARADATFRPDEDMILHVEPIGFGYGAGADGATVDFSVDLTVANATGQVLGEADDFVDLSFDVRPNQRDFAFALTLAAPYMRPGDYKAVFTLTDENSGKSGSFELPFTLTLPASEAASAPAQ
jgi:hypothetical protein